MKLSSFVIAFTILNSVFAARTLRSRSFKHVVHEKRGAPNGAWIKRSLADRESLMPMRIGLTQRNLDDGHDLLMEISDPVSPKYGKHLSHAQVIDMFAPSDESREVVLHWLHSFGINRDRVSVSRNKQWIQFDARVVEAEALLDTTYHIYEHGPSGRVNVACEQYHVPEYIKHHIDYITPGVKLFHLSGPLSPERDKAKKREPQPQPKAALKPTPKGAPGGLGFVLQPIFRTISSFLSGLLTIGFLAGILPCSTTNPMLMTPYCIRQLYSITTLPSNTVINEDNKLGIFQSLGQLYSETDIDLFNTLLTNIPIGEGTPELRSIDGGQGPSSLIQLQMAGAESNLDIQSSHHIIYPQLEAVFSVDDPPTQANYIYPGFLNNFFDGIDGSYCSFEAFGLNGNSNGTDNPLDPPYPNPDSAGKPGAYPGPLDCGTVKPTYVTSISYGGVENILSLPANYQRRQCLEVMKLGLQGYTFVVASGDSGVATGGEDDDDPDGCLRPAGQTTGPGTIFNPDFPSNCPYFLAVGSTQWDSRRTEIATTALGSGGGFSNVHARPSYQSAAVSQYLASANLGFPSYDISAGDTLGANGGVFNRGGRGYPDVAAIGSNLLVIVNAIPMLVGGTSASAPIWAAMLTRVNEERLKRNMPPVGFVHKLLYDNADKFNDITVGNNPGGCSATGFPATAGWDPVTGLGSISFPRLLEIFGVGS